MDAIGFVLATTFLASAFAVFGVVGRIVDGVVDGLRYTVAPTMIGGFGAWAERRTPSPPQTMPPAEVEPPDDTSREGGPGPGDRSREPGGAGLVVPVQRLSQRGWHRFGLFLGAHASPGGRQPG
ncbi:MAG TPA: hypothetical protein VGK16_03720 [Candidatus Limnocylindrales bacterium]|jgi:hypothetical protein